MSEAVDRTLTVGNPRGLHARVAARLVQAVDAHAAEVTLSRDGLDVRGDSIMGLMMLAAHAGCCVHVRAEGGDAAAAVAAVAEVLDAPEAGAVEG